MSLDHIVINTLRNMDDAAAIFEDLGFCLTPRGHHSLGSINHLMLEPRAYLELVGVPQSGRQRQEVLDSPPGLNGLVFRSDDAPATHARLIAAGFDPQEPIILERPVEIEGETRQARFHNVRMKMEEFPAGRVYFCQHLTPDLVWRGEWLTHPNGFAGLAEIAIHSLDPEREARAYAMLAESTAEPSGDDWLIRDGGFTIRLSQHETPGFASATLLFDDLSDISRRASSTNGVEWQEGRTGEGAILVPSLDLRLQCRTA